MVVVALVFWKCNFGVLVLIPRPATSLFCAWLTPANLTPPTSINKVIFRGTDTQALPVFVRKICSQLHTELRTAHYRHTTGRGACSDWRLLQPIEPDCRQGTAKTSR